MLKKIIKTIFVKKGGDEMSISIKRGLTPKGQKCVGVLGLNPRKKWFLTLLGNGILVVQGIKSERYARIQMQNHPKSSFLIKNNMVFSDDLYNLLGADEIIIEPYILIEGSAKDFYIITLH